jgi:hypothetical protein
MHRIDVKEIIPSINQATTRGPVELENSGGVGNRGAVKSEGLLGSVWGRKLDKAIASVAAAVLARVSQNGPEAPFHNRRNNR